VGDEVVALPWIVVLGFLRLVTSARIFPSALSPAQAGAIVQSWFECENVQSLEPGSGHAKRLVQLMKECGAAGNLITDIHLAAMALENRCELHSNDQDFGRFQGLRWVNPLAA
jgi:uncharacterized protein